MPLSKDLSKILKEFLVMSDDRAIEGVTTYLNIIYTDITQDTTLVSDLKDYIKLKLTKKNPQLRDRILSVIDNYELTPRSALANPFSSSASSSAPSAPRLEQYPDGWWQAAPVYDDIKAKQTYGAKKDAAPYYVEPVGSIPGVDTLYGNLDPKRPIALKTDNLNGKNKAYVKFANQTIAGFIEMKEDGSYTPQGCKQFGSDQQVYEKEIFSGNNTGNSHYSVLYTKNMSDCTCLCLISLNENEGYFDRAGLIHFRGGSIGQDAEEAMNYIITNLGNDGLIFGALARNRSNYETPDSSESGISAILEYLQGKNISADNISVYQGYGFNNKNLSFGIDSLGNWGEVIDEV